MSWVVLITDFDIGVLLVGGKMCKKIALNC